MSDRVAAVPFNAVQSEMLCCIRMSTNDLERDMAFLSDACSHRRPNRRPSQVPVCLKPCITSNYHSASELHCFHDRFQALQLRLLPQSSQYLCCTSKCTQCVDCMTVAAMALWYRLTRGACRGSAHSALWGLVLRVSRQPPVYGIRGFIESALPQLRIRFWWHRGISSRGAFTIGKRWFCHLRQPGRSQHRPAFSRWGTMAGIAS